MRFRRWARALSERAPPLTFSLLMPSYPMRLHPHFQKARLPELGVLQRRDVLGRVAEKLLQIVLAKNAALPRHARRQRIPHQVEIGAVDIFELRDGEIALLAVDDLVRNDKKRGILQHALAVVAQLFL